MTREWPSPRRVQGQRPRFCWPAACRARLLWLGRLAFSGQRNWFYFMLRAAGSGTRHGLLAESDSRVPSEGWSHSTGARCNGQYLSDSSACKACSDLRRASMAAAVRSGVMLLPPARRQPRRGHRPRSGQLAEATRGLMRACGRRAAGGGGRCGTGHRMVAWLDRGVGRCQLRRHLVAASRAARIRFRSTASAAPSRAAAAAMRMICQPGVPPVSTVWIRAWVCGSGGCL